MMQPLAHLTFFMLILKVFGYFLISYKKMAVKVETFKDKMFTFFNCTVMIAVTDIVDKDL